ncbi:GL27370, isoform A [Drosophila persimilis]|uniref:GL27370, isoform A n=1 Tax=Drosophila persimilis TaxID=7234 RepID=B4GF62_DROPE|nr:GL27370, isoform A [Drosophila persimilis]
MLRRIRAVPIVVITLVGFTLEVLSWIRIAVTRDDVWWTKHSGNCMFVETRKGYPAPNRKFLTFNHKYETPPGLSDALQGNTDGPSTPHSCGFRHNLCGVQHLRRYYTRQQLRILVPRSILESGPAFPIAFLWTYPVDVFPKGLASVNKDSQIFDRPPRLDGGPYNLLSGSFNHSPAWKCVVCLWLAAAKLLVKEESDYKAHGLGKDNADNNQLQEMDLEQELVLVPAPGQLPRPAVQEGAVTTETVHLYDAASLRQSRFNPFNPTRILIHGWLGNANANIYSALLPPYLSLDKGRYNIFTVDWGRGAIADYITASYRVKPVGQVLAKFVDFLHQEAGLRFEDLQLVGFSMGAHVAGLAGKHLQTGRLRMIRALDPALPFFRYAQDKERLAKGDADYVEVLHTSVGSYGFDRPLGHADFYANWGSQQPGCFWLECSHWRAFILFAESLRPGREYPARGCASANGSS